MRLLRDAMPTIAQLGKCTDALAVYRTTMNAQQCSSWSHRQTSSQLSLRRPPTQRREEATCVTTANLPWEARAPAKARTEIAAPPLIKTAVLIAKLAFSIAASVTFTANSE